MNTQYEFEDLEDYLSNRMSSSDRASFEQVLETDEVLQRRLEALQAESKVLRLLRKEYLLNQLETWSEEKAQSPGQTSHTPSDATTRTVSSKWKFWLLLALLGLLLGYFGIKKAWSDKNQDTPLILEKPILTPDTIRMQQQAPVAQENLQALEKQVAPNTPTPNLDYKALAASTYVEEDFSPTLMGADGDQTPSAYDKAVRFYEEMAYKKALIQLENPKKGQEPEYQYLRGYVYYQMGQYAQAEKEFRAFRNMQNSDRQLDAVWCEVFCLTRQLPAARNRLNLVLEEITANPQHAYYARAKALQSALNTR